MMFRILARRVLLRAAFGANFNVCLHLAVGLFLVFVAPSVVAETTSTKEVERLLIPIVKEWQASIQQGRGSVKASQQMAEGSRLFAEWAKSGGDPGPAMQHMKQAVAQCRADGDSAGEGLTSFIYAASHLVVYPTELGVVLDAWEGSARAFRQGGHSVLASEMDLLLASGHQEIGDLSRALELYKQGLLSIPDLPPGRQAEILYNVGFISMQQGLYREALTALDRSLVLHRASQGETSKAVASTEIALAMLRQNMGHYLSAAQGFQRATTIYEQLGDQSDLWYSRFSLAGNYAMSGRFSEALAIYREALMFYEDEARKGEEKAEQVIASTVPKLGPTSQEFRHSMARLTDLGEYKRRPKLAVADTLHNIGSVQLSLGEEAEAVKSLDAAIKIYSQLAEWRRLGMAYDTLAVFYLNHGRLTQALTAVDSAQKINQKYSLKPGLARCLRLRGLIAGDLGNREEKAALLKEAGAMYSEMGDDSGIADIEYNLGTDALRIEQFDSAIEHFSRALGIYRSNEDVSGLSVIHHCLGQVAIKQLRFKDAERLLRLALQEYAQGTSPFNVVEVKMDLAYILSRTNRVEEALSLSKEAVEMMRSWKADIYLAGGQVSGLTASGMLPGLYLQRADLLLTQGDIVGALNVCEESRNQVMHALRLQNLVAGGGPARSKIETSAMLRERAAELSELLGDKEQSEQSRLEVLELTRQAEVLEAEVARETQSFAGSLIPDIAAVQKRLVEGQAVIYYVNDQDDVHAFVIKSGSLSHRRLGPPDDAVKELNDFLSALRRKRVSLLTLKGLGKELHGILLGPLAADLGSARELIIIPDGLLHRVPFEALVLSDGRYLVERYLVRYAGSLKDLSQTPRTGSTGASLVFGGVEYGLSGHRGPVTGKPNAQKTIMGQKWAYLPESKAEAAAIASELKVQPILGEEATESLFKKLAPQCKVIHVATHGYVDSSTGAQSGRSARAASAFITPTALGGPEFALRNCGLVFSGAEAGGDGENDGILKGAEVAALDLSQADLVVLSACETGLGDLHSGEGVLGLKRAFQIAGARQLVLSLWQVSDASTRELMSRFYSHLSSNSPAEALRLAKLELLRDESKGFESPFYWAPFVIVGPSLKTSPLRHQAQNS